MKLTEDDPIESSTIIYENRGNNIPFDKCHGFMCECGYSDFYHNDRDRNSDGTGACMEFMEFRSWEK